MLTSGVPPKAGREGEREGDVIDSRGATGQPVRLWARTWPGLLRRAGLAAAIACLLDLAIAHGLDLSDWALAIWPISFLVIWLFMLGVTTEWTIEGHELRRRGWLSWPGREPSAVMPLGPQVECVHETRYGWRMQPNGPAIGVWPWQTASLTGAMERAGVRIRDWRGDWAQRHRLIEMFGVLLVYGGAVGLLLTIAQGPGWPYWVATEPAFIGALWLGLAIDFLPWGMRKPSGDLQPQVGPAPGLAFGGFWIRVLAFTIDWIPLVIIDGVLLSAFGAPGQGIGGIIWIAYFIGLWGTRGQTIGMMLCGLRIVRDADGGKLTWGHAVLRFIGLFVAFACIDIGVIWVAFDVRRRGWHDRIGGTVVVQRIGDGRASYFMRRPDVRRGATAGLIMSFALAAALAGSSPTPLQTFFSTLWPPLTGVVVATAFVLAINRRSSRPRDG